MPAPVDADAPPASPEPGSVARVSVRSLCEFTAKRGSLDRRFTPSATALEGLRGQQTVAARRGADYETELALEGRCGTLHVRGRADGWDPRMGCLEEIKAIRGRPEDIPENRRALHWAQLLTYGALFCASRGAGQVTLALVYLDVATQTEHVMREVVGAQELWQAFEQRCAAYEHWAMQEAQHRRLRDAALPALAFPPGAFRPGQHALAAAVWRAATAGRCLLAQAPTGIGKTVGTLFPLLRAMPAQGLDKIAYLTCKGTGRHTALQALASLREGTAGQRLRVLAMVAKEQACEHPGKACHGDACPLAQGFYDRLGPAREQAVAQGWLDVAAQRHIALQHGICPYYLGQELVRWADVLVGDVHHLFDPNGQLFGLLQALDWRVAVLVDEAHNLVERTRRMYSASLSLGELREAQAQAPAVAKAALAQLLDAAATAARAAPEPYTAWPDLPDELADALEAAAAGLAEHFQHQPLATGALLGFHFKLQRWLRLADNLGPHALLDVMRGGGEGRGDISPDAGPDRSADGAADDDRRQAMMTLSLQGADTAVGTPLDDPLTAGETGPAAHAADDAVISLRNLVPAPWLRPRWQALHSATLFSATLWPPEHARQLLGLPDDTAWVDIPPAFPPEHLRVQVARGVSTRYAHRPHSLDRLVAVLARQWDAHPGNYLAFFSSFDYLAQAADRLAVLRPDIPQWRQQRHMPADERQAFLDRFRPDGQGLGFAVLGGVFSEGVDLPGTRLIGAFIATLALPPVSPLQDEMQARLAQLFGAEAGFADRVPAMQKVVQAAGRVLRTPTDRGWLWLLDDRYRQPAFARLLPRWWGLGPTDDAGPASQAAVAAAPVNAAPPPAAHPAAAATPAALPAGR